MEKKERIINGALELFMRMGVKSVNMDDVASHLGMSKKTLYQKRVPFILSRTVVICL